MSKEKKRKIHKIEDVMLFFCVTKKIFDNSHSNTDCSILLLSFSYLMTIFKQNCFKLQPFRGNNNVWTRKLIPAS